MIWGRMANQEHENHEGNQSKHEQTGPHPTETINSHKQKEETGPLSYARPQNPLKMG